MARDFAIGITEIRLPLCPISGKTDALLIAVISHSK
jgi:hypothetical protein|tara:strand:- start:4592 stop:4699 length:108 start_codon:yes stop_codon:yes gene_type:complete